MRIVITTITIIMYHVSSANGLSIIQGFIFIAGMVRNMKQVLNANFNRVLDKNLQILYYYVYISFIQIFSDVAYRVGHCGKITRANAYLSIVRIDG